MGQADERNLFPEAIRLVSEIRPKGVLLENVKGLNESAFDDYRLSISKAVEKFGYRTSWKLLNASDYGVSQLRPRLLFTAVRDDVDGDFAWPNPHRKEAPSVGEKLFDLISARGWKSAESWREMAKTIAPTVVGGSHKHGGPDLGPTRARQAWALLGVDGLGIADEPPAPDYNGMPRLTVRMVARIQGFPDSWQFAGGKTAAYRQVGNAFPPPVARAVGQQLLQCLTQKEVQYAT